MRYTVLDGSLTRVGYRGCAGFSSFVTTLVSQPLIGWTVMLLPPLDVRMTGDDLPTSTASGPLDSPVDSSGGFFFDIFELLTHVKIWPNANSIDLGMYIRYIVVRGSLRASHK